MATKTKKFILDNRLGQVDCDITLRWFALCEKHDTLTGVYTKQDAKNLTTLDFCDACNTPELWCETCSYIITYETMDEHNTRLHSTELVGAR